ICGPRPGSRRAQRRHRVAARGVPAVRAREPPGITRPRGRDEHRAGNARPHRRRRRGRPAAHGLAAPSRRERDRHPPAARRTGRCLDPEEDCTMTTVIPSPPAERRLGLAVRTELRLNSVRALTTAMLCAAALIWAAVSTAHFNGLLTLWAALAWYRYGRADGVEREELRASLGLSRADRIRGRVVLVLAERAAVVATVAAGAVFSVALGRDSAGGAAPFTLSGDPMGPQLGIVLAGALFSMIC